LSAPIKLIQERARETQRIQKLLEDAGIKLDSVATDVLGKAARNMLEALISGERDAEVLADMALTRMRPKIPELRKALVGRFGDPHGLLLRMHLDHVNRLGQMIERLDEEVERLMAPSLRPPPACSAFPASPSAAPRSSCDHSEKRPAREPSYPPRAHRRSADRDPGGRGLKNGV